MHLIDLKENKFLAIAGYSRKTALSQTIPDDILNLIVQFYNTAIFWTVSRETISAIPKQDIFADEDESTLFGPSFVINSTEFKLALQRTSDDYLDYQLYLTDSPSTMHLDELTATVELYCDETKTEYRKFAILRKGICIGWRYHALFFKAALDHTQLNLNADVEILSIEKEKVDENGDETEAQKSNLVWFKPIEINPFNENMRYEWNVNKEILNEFKNCQNGIAFWAPDRFGIGNNFCLYCTPNGCTPYDAGNCVLFIQSLALPYPYKGAVVKFKIECFGGDDFHVQYESCKDLFESVYWPDGTLLTLEIQDLSCIKFVVTMQIMSFNTEIDHILL